MHCMHMFIDYAEAVSVTDLLLVLHIWTSSELDSIVRGWSNTVCASHNQIEVIVSTESLRDRF